ncbi:MAG: hypothetical protein ABIC95_02740 [archaeon]
MNNGKDKSENFLKVKDSQLGLEQSWLFQWLGAIVSDTFRYALEKGRDGDFESAEPPIPLAYHKFTVSNLHLQIPSLQTYEHSNIVTIPGQQAYTDHQLRDLQFCMMYPNAFTVDDDKMPKRRDSNRPYVAHPWDGSLINQEVYALIFKDLLDKNEEIANKLSTLEIQNKETLDALINLTASDNNSKNIRAKWLATNESTMLILRDALKSNYDLTQTTISDLMDRYHIDGAKIQMHDVIEETADLQDPLRVKGDDHHISKDIKTWQKHRTRSGFESFDFALDPFVIEDDVIALSRGNEDYDEHCRMLRTKSIRQLGQYSSIIYTKALDGIANLREVTNPDVLSKGKLASFVEDIKRSDIMPARDDIIRTFLDSPAISSSSDLYQVLRRHGFIKEGPDATLFSLFNYAESRYRTTQSNAYIITLPQTKKKDETLTALLGTIDHIPEFEDQKAFAEWLSENKKLRDSPSAFRSYLDHLVTPEFRGPRETLAYKIAPAMEKVYRFITQQATKWGIGETHPEEKARILHLKYLKHRNLSPFKEIYTAFKSWIVLNELRAFNEEIAHRGYAEQYLPEQKAEELLTHELNKALHKHAERVLHYETCPALPKQTIDHMLSDADGFLGFSQQFAGRQVDAREIITKRSYNKSMRDILGMNYERFLSTFYEHDEGTDRWILKQGKSFSEMAKEYKKIRTESKSRMTNAAAQKLRGLYGIPDLHRKGRSVMFKDFKGVLPADLVGFEKVYFDQESWDIGEKSKLHQKKQRFSFTDELDMAQAAGSDYLLSRAFYKAGLEDFEGYLKHKSFKNQRREDAFNPAQLLYLTHRLVDYHDTGGLYDFTRYPDADPISYPFEIMSGYPHHPIYSMHEIMKTKSKQSPDERDWMMASIDKDPRRRFLFSMLLHEQILKYERDRATSIRHQAEG